MYQSIKDRDFDKADALAKTMKEHLTEENEKYEIEITFLSFKFLFGGINSLDELKQKSENAPSHKLKIKGYRNLAECYETVQNYKEAISYYDKCLQIEDKQVDRADIASKLCKCYYNHGEKTECLEFLSSMIISTDEPLALSKLYISISDFFEKENDKMSKSIALELAVANNPTDLDTLFQLAYDYSLEPVNMNNVCIALSKLIRF